MTQTIGIESPAEQDPAVLAWGEVFTGVVLREALSELLDRATESGRKLVGDNVGVVALKAAS